MTFETILHLATGLGNYAVPDIWLHENFLPAIIDPEIKRRLGNCHMNVGNFIIYVCASGRVGGVQYNLFFRYAAVEQRLIVTLPP